MAARTPVRGGVGWAILTVALAVPGFLFYNWWSHLKSERDRGVASKSHARPQGTVFQTPPTNRLVNPIAVAAASNVSSTAAAVSSNAEAPAAAHVPSVTPTASSPAAPGASAAVVAATVTISLARDPMMSPMDLVRIREEQARRAELAERIRLEAERGNHRGKIRGAAREKPIEKLIELQGIVATPAGATLAIVNGATVNEGESFSVGKRPGKVKVLRISTSAVTFEYKGRRFKISVNAE